MKFCKKYEYMQGQERKLPEVGFKKLKKILKKCRRDFHPGKNDINNLTLHDPRTCPDHCPVCDGSFFPSLLNEMSDVVGFFNQTSRALSLKSARPMELGGFIVNNTRISSSSFRALLLSYLQCLLPKCGSEMSERHVVQTARNRMRDLTGSLAMISTTMTSRGDFVRFLIFHCNLSAVGFLLVSLNPRNFPKPNFEFIFGLQSWHRS